MERYKSKFNEDKKELKEISFHGNEKIVNTFLDILVTNDYWKDIVFLVLNSGDDIDNKHIANLFIQIGKEILKHKYKD